MIFCSTVWLTMSLNLSFKVCKSSPIGCSGPLLNWYIPINTGPKLDKIIWFQASGNRQRRERRLQVELPPRAEAPSGSSSTCGSASVARGSVDLPPRSFHSRRKLLHAELPLVVEAPTDQSEHGLEPDFCRTSTKRRF